MAKADQRATRRANTQASAALGAQTAERPLAAHAGSEEAELAGTSQGHRQRRSEAQKRYFNKQRGVSLAGLLTSQAGVPCVLPLMHC